MGVKKEKEEGNRNYEKRKKNKLKKKRDLSLPILHPRNSFGDKPFL